MKNNMTDPLEEQIAKVLSNFDTWCLCGNNECSKSENFEEAKTKLIDLVRGARIEELNEAKPILTDYSVAYSRVTRLEDDRGDIVWVENVEEYIDERIAKLNNQRKDNIS